jgi:hypothetical protein
VLGRKATPAAIIPNMAIRNSDVIVQAMVRLPLHNAWTVPPKARRANAVALPRVGSPPVRVTAGLIRRKRAYGRGAATVARANGGSPHGWKASNGTIDVAMPDDGAQFLHRHQHRHRKL